MLIPATIFLYVPVDRLRYNLKVHGEYTKIYPFAYYRKIYRKHAWTVKLF